ncbi:hypothetical protein CMV_020974 [Castanea mollissima]|uniref:RNase H type-1 domain-containing protein n=1 Tax=Castanea mollissima TaxID=60419 RepID=A0A8J4QVQ2_9ROSI|nr:hypothetical protein CMV_020974 [Castanea mollissima]
MASRFTGSPLSFFIYTSPSPSQEEEEQQQQQQYGSPTSVLPVSLFSSREQQQIQIGTPLNAPKIINPSFSISPTSDDLRMPYTTDDDDAVLQNLIHIIRSVIMKSNSPSKRSRGNWTELNRPPLFRWGFPNPLWGRLHWPILDIPNSNYALYRLLMQQQIGSPKTPVSGVTPVSFFSSREEQFGSPVTPVNAAKTRRDMLISPSPNDQFHFLTIQAIETKEVRSVVGHIVRGILQNLSSFQEAKVRHIGRDGNKIAHELAQLAKQSAEEHVWTSIIPDWIEDMARAEGTG